ncbi:universal stress protein [Aquibacillus halophilus]|uniref:universal stress protein n=1 Tax=Aquibacillus halophilus TaxID=930132 RepID=UPI00147892CD
MNNTLIVAIDGSQQSLSAIDYAVKLARASGYTIELLHVQPKINTHYANKKIGKKQLQEYKKEQAMKVLKKGKMRVDKDVDLKVKWRQGLTAEEVCCEAKDVQALGIIMGARSVKKIKGRLLGSTCYSVIKNAPCPVTIVS